MRDALLSGLLTGWAIAVPVGAVALLLVTLSSRAGWRVGAAGALGVASVDVAYATVAVVAGAAASRLLAPVSTLLGVLAGLVLLGVAALVLRSALAPPGPERVERPLTPLRAYLALVGITALNPATVVYFAAVVLGDQRTADAPAEAIAFVLGVAVASGGWQLLLSLGGVALGRRLATPRARLVTGVLAALLIAGLGVRTALGA